MRQCKTCKQEFSGRRNQLYCSTSCKSEVNNEIARERSYDFKRMTKKFQINQRTVIGNKLIDREKVSINQLEKSGFDFSYSIKTKHDKVTGEIYMISDSIYFTKINSEYVRFGKL